MNNDLKKMLDIEGKHIYRVHNSRLLVKIQYGIALKYFAHVPFEKWAQPTELDVTDMTPHELEQVLASEAARIACLKIRTLFNG